ncbi:peptidylprolyl isomerase [Arenibacterium sp. CAU 1754]
MLKGLTFLPSLALAATMALSVPAYAAPDAGTVVARVNGQEITLGHMIVAHATLPQQYQQLPPEVLFNAILDQLIQQSALNEAYTGDVPLHVQLSLENEKRSLIAAEEIEKIMSTAASDDQVRAEYDAKYADGFGGQEFNAAHILVETQEEATAIKAEIEAGADFAAVAKEKSTGPSGPNGGALNWFGLGAMVPEFETAVVALEPGQVSDPVQTQFGWHVILLNETRKAKAPSLDEVRGEIEDGLRQKAVEARIEELTSAATVERPEIEDLNPEILRNLDLIRN